MTAGLWEAVSAGSVGFAKESPLAVAGVAVTGVAIGVVAEVLGAVTVGVVVAAAEATGVTEGGVVIFGVSGTMQVRDCRTRRLRRLGCNFLGLSMKGKSS